jgi:monoamine oxidase
MRIVVAGAGLAGLIAARDLEAHGAEVIVVEARDRVGGRVHTVRAGFADGQHAEAGADLIEAEQTHVLALATELGLNPVRILRHGWGFYGPDKTGRLRIRSGPGAFGEAARRLEPEIAQYQLAEGRWDSPITAAIARTSIAVWLARTDADAGFAAAMRGLRGFFLADPEDLSLIALVDEFASGETPGDARQFRIADGNDRLASATARQLQGRVLLRNVVRRVTQNESGVRIVVETQDSTTRPNHHVLDADYAVLALPASTLRDVQFDPVLPAEQARAIATLRYGAATRVLLQFATRFWRRPGRPLAFGTDQPTGAAWDGNEQQARRPGILSLLAGGRASADVQTIISTGGMPALIDRLRWLGSPSALLRHRLITWEHDPWARGGYAFFDPSFPTALRDWLPRPFGRVAFAGEHTSFRWQGYMNGALESGKRAAAEVRAMQALSGR